MSKPEGIYLSVDYRVTDARTRALIDDESIKNLTIHYPPLGNDGPKVLLGFSSLARLRDGTPVLTWIRKTLRGESEFIDQSMAHLRARLNRDIARLRVPLIVNLLVLEKKRRLFGGLSNLRINPQGQTSDMTEFHYVMNEPADWTIFANGSGMKRLIKDGHFARLIPHLGVVPRQPMNHMNLLAVINRQVAAKDSSVSPFCHVSFINSDDRFSPVSHSFTERGESVSFEMPFILAGIDLTDVARRQHNNLKAWSQGKIPAMPEIDQSIVTNQVKRRP